MDLLAVQKAYSRWSFHYDFSFGLISDAARLSVVDEINEHTGRLLEVGVGTGLSLPHYRPDLSVCGIDVSDKMLGLAKKRVKNERIKNVEALHNMDATFMSFPDNSFDVVTAMHILSVAPNPEGIMKEIERVTKPGGSIYIMNHFSSNNKAAAFLEKNTSAICRFIGWHSDFDQERLKKGHNLDFVEEKKLKPFGLFKRLIFKKKS